jgi:hypothetical protein
MTECLTNNKIKDEKNNSKPVNVFYSFGIVY